MAKWKEFSDKISVIAEQITPNSTKDGKIKYPISAKAGENITATIDKDN